MLLSFIIPPIREGSEHRGQALICCMELLITVYFTMSPKYTDRFYLK